jgi:DNA-binding phage protein
VHVAHPTGNAKFWLAPRLSLARNDELSSWRLATALRLIEESPDSNVTLHTLERVARAMDLQLDIRLTPVGGVAA